MENERIPVGEDSFITRSEGDDFITEGIHFGPRDHQRVAEHFATALREARIAEEKAAVLKWREEHPGLWVGEQLLPSREDCDCICHERPGVMHMFPCCRPA